MCAKETVPPRLTIPGNRATPPQATASGPSVIAVKPSRWKLAALNSLTTAAGVVAVLGITQVAIPDSYRWLRPSVIYGTFTGEMAAADLEAQTRAASAYAQGKKAGELSAQIVYENQLAAIKVQAEKQIAGWKALVEGSNRYYEALYAAFNKSVETGMRMEAELASQRSYITSSTQGGARFFAGLLDGLGTLGELTGDPTLSEMKNTASTLRRKMEQELGDAAASGAGNQYQALMSQVPSMQSLREQQLQWFREGAGQ